MGRVQVGVGLILGAGVGYQNWTHLGLCILKLQVQAHFTILLSMPSKLREKHCIIDFGPGFSCSTAHTSPPRDSNATTYTIQKLVIAQVLCCAPLCIGHRIEP